MNSAHKLYRLKKDTLFAKVGTVFSLKHGVLESRGTVFTFRLHKSSISDFGDWFEKIVVYKPWVPRHGDMYLYLDDRGDLSKSINVNVRSDTHRIATGNCYRENTPESVIIKEQRFIPEALNILITEAKKEWYVHTGLLEPDFNDWAQPKYYPVYSMSEQRFIVEKATKYVSFGIYLPTKESCKQHEAQQMRAHEMMIAQDSEKAKALYGSEHVDTKNDRRLRKYVTIKPRARQVSTNIGYKP